MAHLGRNLIHYRLRRTSLCRAEPTIIDAETILDLKEAYKEVSDEIATNIVVRKFYSAAQNLKDSLYNESRQKIWREFTIPGIVTIDPAEKELIEWGIREQADILVKVNVDDLMQFGLFGNEPDGPLTVLNSDDHIIAEGQEFSIYKIGNRNPIQGEYIRIIITGRIYNMVPSETKRYVVDKDGNFVLDSNGNYVVEA